MTLGMFVFDDRSLPFHEISRRSEWRHAASDRAGARPALQFVGPGADDVELTGALVPEVAGRYASLETIRQMADEGEAQQLMDGNGRLLGDYVIVSLDTTGGYLFEDGTPRRVDFTLRLGRAG